MPLIIHPESSCDVCLENLTYDDYRPPYAIPCGHVFCGACLYQIHPRICPLCREPYSLEPTKKLITGERPTEIETPTNNERTVNDEGPAVNDSAEDDELLRRLIISWDMQEEQLSALLTQVDTWLQGRPQDTSMPLRKAREVHDSYRELTTHAENDRRTIGHLRSSLRIHEHLASSDRYTAVAVEQSLLGQMEELHMKVNPNLSLEKTLKTHITLSLSRNKLSQCQSENDMLREEISKSKNPPPPSPKASESPIEGFLPFARSSTSGNSGSTTTHRWYPTSGTGHTSPYSAPSSPTTDYELRMNTSIFGASPNSHIPSRRTSLFGGGEPSPYESSTNLHNERPVGLHVRFDNNSGQAQYLDSYTPTPTSGTLQLIRNFPVFI